MSLEELYCKDTRIWTPDPLEVWQGGTLLEDFKRGMKELKVALENGGVISLRLRDAERDLPPLRNPEILTGENNLTSLSYLNEPEVLHNLRIRFLDRRIIYTYCGIVLVAINPYSEMQIYDDTVIAAYSGCEDVCQSLEPHVFGVAEQAFNHMTVFGQNQSIIVSGESGSGKTVNARYALRYLATVASAAAGSLPQTAADLHQSHIEDRVLASNPILEAFGNAKTTRNDNSSRFGKYIQISIAAQQISHASIRTYLLEKSRVVTQAFNERNYHIFYQLCSTQDQSLALAAADSFRYLSAGQCWTIDNVDDADELNITRQAFRTLGLTDADEWHIFTLLAAVLHLGNVEISAGETSESAAIAEQDAGLKAACDLLKVDEEQLRTWLLHRRIVTVGEELIKPFTVEEAANARDALAKFAYASLFAWLVAIINKALERRASRQEAALPFIGILDIYGFEIFAVNSFEQFCINYANEKLQQQFNTHVFKLEQQIYIAEEIEWSFVNFNDNQACIELIESKLGILDLLDEESKMMRGSDTNWLQKMTKTLSKSQHFALPKIGSREAFLVRHFAEPVTYCVAGFLEKNKDAIFEDQLSILKASELDFMSKLFSGNADCDKPRAAQGGAAFKEPVGAASRSLQKFNRQTVAAQFKGSLSELMDTLTRTNPHFIRCIKPNDEKQAFSMSCVRSVEQLRACGVLETVRISAAGFPSRWTYEEFYQRYRLFAPPKKQQQEQQSQKQICAAILQQCMRSSDGYKIGKTRIFFRAGEVAFMEKLRSDRLRWACTMVQRHFRGWRQRRRYAAVRRTVLLLQAAARGLLARGRALAKRQLRSALRIQSYWRMIICTRRLRRQRAAAVAIQCWFRRVTARRMFMKLKAESLVVNLQRCIRGYLVRKRIGKLLRGITLLQSHFRRRKAKQQLLRLRREARDIDNLRSKNFGLENRLIELQNRLDARAAQLHAAGDKDKLIQDLRLQLEEAKAREMQLLSENSELSRVAGELRLAAAASQSEASEASRSLQVEMQQELQAEAEQHRSCLAQLQAQLEAKEEELQQLRQQLQQLQDELADSAQVGSSHMKLMQEYDKLQNKFVNLSNQYAYIVSQRNEGSEEAPEALPGNASARPRSRTEGSAESQPVGLLLQLQKKLSSSERERKNLQRQLDRAIEQQAAASRTTAAADDERAAMLEAQLKDLQHASLKGSGGKEVMRQLDSMRQELQVRREECLKLKAALGEQIVSERYGGNSELLNEDGELELAYQTLQQVNRRLKNELDDLAEQLNSKGKLVEQLEVDKARQQKLLTQMHAIFNSPAVDNVDSVVKFELQRMLAENLELRAENERMESENKRLRKHSNVELNEVNHEAAIPVPSEEVALDLPQQLLKLELPGNAPYILFCAVRWCDSNGKDAIVAKLLTETVRVWREHCKKHKADLQVLLVWFNNAYRLLNLLRQYGGEARSRYTSDNSSEERSLQLHRFDLGEFTQLLHDLGVWQYQQICLTWQQQLAPQTLVLGLLEHEGIPGLPSVAKKKIDPAKAREALELISRRCCELARHAQQAAMPEALTQQLIEQALRWICAHCVNNLLLRRDLCHWARGMQLRYNLSHLESQLRELGLSSALAALEPLVQASQLLQANKQSKDDADAIATTTTLLNRGQVTKLLNLYNAQDQFEEKVSPEFIQIVGERMAIAGGGRRESEAVFIDLKELRPVRLTFHHDPTELRTVPIPSHFLDFEATPAASEA